MTSEMACVYTLHAVSILYITDVMGGTSLWKNIKFKLYFIIHYRRSITAQKRAPIFLLVVFLLHDNNILVEEEKDFQR